jgi:nucleoside-diphosphate-sugar epimerase
VPLLGHPHTRGQAFHITSDEALPWNEITLSIASAAGVDATLVHVPSDVIAAADPQWGAGLLGDKSHSMVFDKLEGACTGPDYRASIPFEQGARDVVAWHDADTSRQRVDSRLDALMDRLVAQHQVQ